MNEYFPDFNFTLTDRDIKIALFDGDGHSEFIEIKSTPVLKELLLLSKRNIQDVKDWYEFNLANLSFEEDIDRLLNLNMENGLWDAVSFLMTLQFLFKKG